MMNPSHPPNPRSPFLDLNDVVKKRKEKEEREREREEKRKRKEKRKKEKREKKRRTKLFPPFFTSV